MTGMTDAEDVAISIDSIINNGVEETGNSRLEDLTHDELVTLVNKIHAFVNGI